MPEEPDAAIGSGSDAATLFWMTRDFVEVGIRFLWRGFRGIVQRDFGDGRREHCWC